MIVTIKNEFFDNRHFISGMNKVYSYNGVIPHARIIKEVRNKVAPHLELYNEKKKNLLEKYCTRDEEAGNYIPKEGEEEKLESEIVALKDKDVELSITLGIPADIDIKLNSFEYEKLEGFFQK